MCAGLRQPCTRCSSSEKCLKERSGRALADKHCGSAVLQSSSTFMVSSFSSFRVPWSCGKDGKTEMVAYDKCHNSDMCSVKRIYIRKADCCQNWSFCNREDKEPCCLSGDILTTISRYSSMMYDNPTLQVSGFPTGAPRRQARLCAARMFKRATPDCVFSQGHSPLFP